MPIPGTPFTAGGNVRPRRIVQITAANSVVEATAATQALVGVSAPWVRQVPYSTLDDGFHAIAGEGVTVYGQGEIAPVQVGAAVSVGARITADSAGRGVTASATNSAIGIALQPATAADQVIEVLLAIHTA